jgi:hypothetical protein
MIWSPLIADVGQFLIALVASEAVAHFPGHIAGSLDISP